MKNLLLIIILTLIASFSCTQNLVPQDDPLAIPFCNEIIVDASASDWAGRGLHIPLIANLYGERAQDDFSAILNLAWDSTNLYFLVEADDDLLVEKKSPLQGDGLEIFISGERGTNKMVQYIISPGVTGAYTKPRVDKYDYAARGPESDVQEVTVMAIPTSNGYLMEGKIPFQVLGISPGKGIKLALNLYLSDVDPDERKTRYALYFNQDTWSNHFALRELVLEETGEGAIDAIVKAFTEDRRIHRIKVISEKASGARLSVQDGYGYKKQVPFKEVGDIFLAELDIPVEEIDSSATFLQLEYMDGCKRAIYFRDISQRYIEVERPNRWEDDILLFEEMDKLNFPQEGGAVFIGSSSIRLWSGSLADDFDGCNVICRGFGGSTTGDALYYFDRIVAPYNPSVIVLAEGSNDIGRGDSPKEIIDLTEQFILKAADELPEAKVLVMSIKVSVTRKRLVETVLETNTLLKDMINRHNNAEYVDVVSEMLSAEGKVRAEIFSADSTHMNASGYEIWTRIMLPYLEKYLPEN